MRGLHGERRHFGFDQDESRLKGSDAVDQTLDAFLRVIVHFTSIITVSHFSLP